MTEKTEKGLTKENRELLISLYAALGEQGHHTLQFPISKETFKEVSNEFSALQLGALEMGMVLIGVEGDKSHRPRLRVSSFPLLLALTHMEGVLSGRFLPSETEKRSIAWLKGTTSVQELLVLQHMVMDLEIRTRYGDKVEMQHGAYARLAQVIADNYAQLKAEVH